MCLLESIESKSFKSLHHLQPLKTFSTRNASCKKMEPSISSPLSKIEKVELNFVTEDWLESKSLELKMKATDDALEPDRKWSYQV